MTQSHALPPAYIEQWMNDDWIFPWHQKDFEKLMTLFQQRMPQTVLLSGLTLNGLLKLAFKVSMTLLCESQKMICCHTCPSCHWMSARTHPDFRCLLADQHISEICPESFYRSLSPKTSAHIAVDDLRTLANFFSLSTHRGRRVILIAPVESLSEGASEALLKILEEPLPQTIFILMSYRPHQLKPTLLSRCQVRLGLEAPQKKDIAEWMNQLDFSLKTGGTLSSWVEQHPLYHVLFLVTKTDTSATDFFMSLFQVPFDFFSVTTQGVALVRCWEKIIELMPAWSVLLDLLLTAVRDYLVTLNFSSDQKSIRSWLYFFDVIQEGRSSLSSSMNQQLLLEKIMASHPFL